MIKILIQFFGIFAFTVAFAQTRNSGVVQEGYFISDRSLQKKISQMPALTIDHISPRGFEVWGPRGLGQ